MNHDSSIKVSRYKLICHITVLFLLFLAQNGLINQKPQSILKEKGPQVYTFKQCKKDVYFSVGLILNHSKTVWLTGFIDSESNSDANRDSTSQVLDFTGRS